MFDYEKELSDGKLCELFIRHGNLKSDGVNIIQQKGYMYKTLPPPEASLEMRKLLTPETRLNISPFKLEMIIKLLIQDPDIRVDSEVRNTGHVVFRNGIYSAVDGKLYSHKDEYNWAVVDADYEESVSLEDAPVFYDFVCSSLEYKTNPEKTELLLEILGYALSDYTVAKKAFFFIGEPSSGKSKILEMLQQLVGDEEVTQIALPRIGSRFSIGQMRGKRMNICTELPDNKFPSIESFKALSACDRVYGELKGKDGFSYYPRIKLLNAGNSMPFPANTDGTLSLADRMVFLMFDRSIPREQWNMELVSDLLEERNIICSMAMQRLKRLVESGFAFALPEDSEAFARSYTDAMNAFRLFIEEACELREDAYTGSVPLWESYKEFCEGNVFPLGIHQQLFAQKVEALNGVRKERIRDSGRQMTVFRGIALRRESDESARTEARYRAEKNTGNGSSDSKIRKGRTIPEKSKLSCTASDDSVKRGRVYRRQEGTG